MKEIKIDRKDYVVLPQAELDILLAEARAISYVDRKPYKPLRKNNLSPTECRFIESLRENVIRNEKIIVQQYMMNGKGISFFRFHLQDIGGT